MSFSSSQRLALALAVTSMLQPTLGAQGRIEVWGVHGSGFVLQPPSGNDFVQVDCGLNWGVGRRSDGSIESWGYGYLNQVSDVPAGIGYIDVEVTDHNGVALRADGSISTWGSDATGMVSETPSESGFIQVTCGAGSAVARRGDGSLVAWGLDTSQVVTDLPQGQGFTQVSLGGGYGLAIAADSSIARWGAHVPPGGPMGTGFTQVQASRTFAVALRTDGSIVVWGDDTQGVVSGAPTGMEFTQIAVGLYHALAMTADGTVEFWGLPWGAQWDYSYVSTEPGFSAIAAGSIYSLGINEHNIGSSFCYGDGSGTSCPCGNDGAPGEGCMGSQGTGTTLTGFGDANMPADSFRLEIRDAKPMVPCLILRGSNQMNGGLGVIAGSGLLCVGGQVARSQVFLTGPTGDASFTHSNGTALGAWSHGAGVPTTYQAWYRDPASTCSSSSQFSNGWTVTWE